MSYILQRDYGESSYKITVKRRKSQIMLLEEEINEGFTLASYVESELPEPKKVVVFIIRLEISEEEEEDIWEIDKEIEIAIFDNLTEMTLPVETFWSDDFLVYGKHKKWFKYKLEIKKEDGTVEKKGGRRARYKTVDSFSTKLLRWLGVPTEEEWLEKNKNKKDLRKIVRRKKHGSK